MDTNQPTDKPTTPSKDPAALPNTPTDPGKPELDPGELQKRKILRAAIIALIAMFVFVSIIVAIVSLASRRPTRPTTNPQATSIAPKPNLDANAVSKLGPERLFITKTATQKVPYDLSITTPTAWQSKFSDQTSANYPWENSILVQAMLSRFSPLSTTNIDISSGNYLAIIDVTGWLTTNQNVIPLNAAQKQAWYASLTSVTPENVGRIGANLQNPRLREAGGRQHIQPIATTNNTFRGFSYLTLTSQNYTPAIVTMLAGTVEGRSLVVYSVHNVRDSLWASNNELRERSDPGYAQSNSSAVSAFASGQLNDDSLQIHNEHIRAVSTLSLTKVQQ